MNKRIIFMLIIMALVWAPGALSKPEFLTSFEATYPGVAAKKIDACLLCHAEDPKNNTARNPYGLDFGNYKTFAAIESRDSDRDGYSNIDEIHNLTFPGSAGDHPVTITPTTVPPTTIIPTTAPPTAVPPTAIPPTKAPPAVVPTKGTPGFGVVLVFSILVAVYILGRKKR